MQATTPKKSVNQGRIQDFRLYLQEELLRRCERNRSYSMRSFAKALDCDFSLLAKLLRGKRSLGRLTITRLGASLGLSPEEVREFVEFHAARAHPAKRETQAGSEATINESYQQVALDSFRIISDWCHFAILELMRLDSFRPDRKWIATSLRMSESEANIAIERLTRVGLIEIDPRTKAWRDTSEGFSTTIGTPFTDAALKRLQRQLLEKALQALEDTPLAFRDQSAMTMAIDSSKLPEAKERIKRFRRELDQFLGQGKSLDQVYNLSVSLYPLTQINRSSKGKIS